MKNKTLKTIFILGSFFYYADIIAHNQIDRGPHHIRSFTKHVFNFYDKANKYPVQLKWSKVPEASYYKVEINNQHKKRGNTFKKYNNNMHVSLYPNQQYQWRVIAYDKGDNQLSKPSYLFNLIVNTHEKSLSQTENHHSKEIEILTEDSHNENHDNSHEENIESIDNNTDTISAIESEAKLNSKYWLTGGLGLTSPFFEQENKKTALYEYSSNKISFSGEFGFFIRNNLALVLSAWVTPDKITEDSGNFQSSFTWTDISTEALYFLESNRFDTTWHIRLGINYQTIPVVGIFTNGDNIIFSRNDQISASLGLGLKKQFTENWSSNFYLNILYAIINDSNEFNLDDDTGYGLKTLITLNYNITEKLQTGLYWRAKYVGLDMQLSNAISSTEIDQSLFKNNLGLLLKYIF